MKHAPRPLFAGVVLSTVFSFGAAARALAVSPFASAIEADDSSQEMLFAAAAYLRLSGIVPPASRPASPAPR